MRLALLDHMGYGNLGDAATQDAVIANIKRRLPDADIVAFSLNPQDTRKRHNVPCYPITYWYPGRGSSADATMDGGNVALRLKSILKKVPLLGPMAKRAWHLLLEMAHLWRSFIVLRSVDSLIFSGGGQLGELWLGPWKHPYNVLKFSVLAKLAGKKLLFLNVGAGPLNRTLSRAFVKTAVRLADYVSFRDVESRTLVRRLGVKRETHVSPDTVYALDIAKYQSHNAVTPSLPVVGLNPIGFCDPRIWPRKDYSVYTRYLDDLASFSLWLLANNYRIRVLSAERSVDVFAVGDLKGRLLKSLSPADVNDIVRPPCESVDELLVEMSQFDSVLTSKFHGVVFSHLLAKPVLALSYHRKIDDLMRAAGHSQYCLSIESFDEESLKRTFSALMENAKDFKAKCRETATAYSGALRAQFDELFVPANLQVDFRAAGAVRNGAAVSRSA